MFYIKCFLCDFIDDIGKYCGLQLVIQVLYQFINKVVIVEYLNSLRYIHDKKFRLTM